VVAKGRDALVPVPAVSKGSLMAVRPPRTAGKINTQGMNLPNFMPQGRMVVQPIINVDAKGPLKLTSNLEHRLSQARLQWFLRSVVSPYMSDVIVDRFAWGGDKTVGGPWPPLAAYTEKLKRSMGAPSDAPNERTGDMLHHLAYDHAVEPWTMGALLRIPDRSDGQMEKKIQTAQEGESAGSNPFGGETPPRPVLGIGPTEEQVIDRMFDTYLWGGLT
jgi:hypothetical protein